MGNALRLALTSMALSSAASAQGLAASNGVNMNSTGLISNAPTITFPNGTTMNWETSTNLQGYMVPAGQLTGLNMNGTAVSYEDLLPLKVTKISIAAGAAGAAPTGFGTIIDAAGIETNALSLLDSGTSALAPITIVNGVLQVGGIPVGEQAAVNLAEEIQLFAPAAAGHTLADIPGGELTTLAGAGVSITIAPFKMARTELTFGEWHQGLRWALQNNYTFAATTGNFWDNTGRATPQLSTDMTNAGTSPVVIKFAGAAASEIRNSGGHSLGSADHPVVGVSWFDVVKWCNARSEMDGFAPVYYIDVNGDGDVDAGDTVFKTGEPAHATIIADPAANGLRLPSESEWEWAARGGNMAAFIYPWGTTTISGVQASYQNHDYSTAPFRGRTSPVGSFPAGVNPYGLHDMAGNVWEWTADIHPTNSALRVPRGGSWNNTGSQLQVSLRAGNAPARRDAHLGFRIVRN